MKRRKPMAKPEDKKVLVIRTGRGGALGRTQTEFNRLMKSLEEARARHLNEQKRLDEVLAISINDLMPLVEEINRTNRNIVFHGYKALQTLKLTARCRESFTHLLCGHAENLLNDPVGLGEDDLSELEVILETIEPSQDGKGNEVGMPDQTEFDMFRSMIQQMARNAGVDLDLSGLDANTDPEEFKRLIAGKFDAAEGVSPSPHPAAKPGRKQTKARMEKERKRLELEKAKSRDLKSLFKQLAKAFHPDLEPEPQLKEHKKIWMQRLNTAYAAADLREMLQLEMEWLGEESANLATAGDEKLKVYCMVLKEQIAELKQQTHHLLNEPQYGPLNRFRDPYFGTLAKPETVGRELRLRLAADRLILEALGAGNARARKIINELVDEHQYRLRRMD
ncbi:J domain-containing protein [Luteolibacter yonseiensis]|uniref:J domain-containing protein n=1 Tax=Luteolibacter yonseiensis TaxID=1144680 RepID=A0A934R122_9BACT|nr:J domain-containing protein [Luteolibacter yonseiensis]MBK1814782.1 J domain-containing protein [Luteolibacter yonseiensis]